MMRQLWLTADGSHTIYIPEHKVTYHSTHGAIQESRHVYIEAGLRPLIGIHDTLSVFETGFGTGLNALLALKEALQNKQAINYTAVEPFPLQEAEYGALNYCELLNDDELRPYFLEMHAGLFEVDIAIHPLFRLTKINKPVGAVVFSQTFHCIFFDAFAPNDQPELWTTEIFEKMFALLKNGGTLVTYCAKGDVRRRLKAAGFNLEKIAGPPGKKEMLRAIKPAA